MVFPNVSNFNLNVVRLKLVQIERNTKRFIFFISEMQPNFEVMTSKLLRKKTIK